MRTHLTALSAALLAVSGCQDVSAPIVPPVFRVTATITEENQCSVTSMGKTYTSNGRIRGDKPAQFVGTQADVAYHGFGCEVSTSGTEADIIVLFSGNHLGKPLEPGVYQLTSQIANETPPGLAYVIFNSDDYSNFKLRTTPTSGGTVTVELTPTGGRKITVDVDAVQWGEPF